MNYSSKYSEECKAAIKSIFKKFVTWVLLNACMHSYRISTQVCREHCELTLFLCWVKTCFRLVEGEHFFCLPCQLPTDQPFRKQFWKSCFCGATKWSNSSGLPLSLPSWEGGCSVLCCPTRGKIHFAILSLKSKALSNIMEIITERVTFP